ncbi:hypothetical protein ES705_33189 [subsurface metagenome]
MKILAIEKEKIGINQSDYAPYLKEEVQHVIGLIEQDIIREIYFDENKNAIIVLECQDKKEAKKVLSGLPLVKAGLITFELSELNPYTGFSRLIT